MEALFFLPGVTSKAEPSFESKYSSNPSTAPAQTSKMGVPESGKTCPDSLSHFPGLIRQFMAQSGER